MKYKELLNFEPITEIVRFDKTGEAEYQKQLVKTFVFSDALKNTLIPIMVSNIDFNYSGESFGLQVVGNYGTGKSHLMSLVSLIAEDSSLLDSISEEKAKTDLSKIAGKFKVLRFELGNTESLWDIITYKLEEYLNDNGIEFSFDGHGPKTYAEKIQLMMAEFEEVYPNKGFIVVIDEMLSYLKSRNTTELNSDLAVLQALGQSCDSSKFKFMFGVQEMIYQSSEFQFAADMLQKVNDRYKDIMITKDDVAYIVKNRLLKKDEHQKLKIKQHIDPFLKFFTDMHARTQEYIDLYPVHPTYFENFEKIRIGKSQREILKTLSNQFIELLDKDVPDDNPGMLTYDKYWANIQANQDLMAIPDVRKTKEITDTIKDKISLYFTGGRFKKIGIAERITNACAIRLLQHNLNQQNGTNTEHLVDDLCLTDNLAFDRDFLIDIMDSTAQQIITATSGQYFDKDSENGEFHLRVEGGVNFDQKIKDYAGTMSLAQKDESFYEFLKQSLPMDKETYRTGFNIWPHTIEWKSHKTYREGYIFFGNPNEKSTTEPKQNFYMYFMPIFDKTKMKRNNESDEVYYIMEKLSVEFREAVTLYGAAISLQVRADSAQKVIYNQKIKDILRKTRKIFEQEYINITLVEHKGQSLPLKGYSLPSEGSTKQQVFSEVAMMVLEPFFDNELENYPKFTQLNNPITKDNYHRLIKQALIKISNPLNPNRDAEGILSGLGLWVPGNLDISNSIYAKSILRMLNDKGENKVLNRDEILECFYAETNIWFSKDFRVEAELEFIVLAVLAALGEIDITLSSGKSINASNLSDLLNLESQDYFAFTHIKRPKGLNIAALKQMFTGLLNKDLSNQLNDPDTYTTLVNAANNWAKISVSLAESIKNGIQFEGIEIITPHIASEYNITLKGFAGFCDKLATYTSEAKMKNFQYAIEEVKHQLDAIPKIKILDSKLKQIKEFREDVSYLQQCRQYIIDDSLKSKITKSISEVADIIDSNDEKAIANHKNILKSLKEEYAQWYLEQYLKYRISERDNTKKQALLDSDEKLICDVLKDADFLSVASYYAILDKLNKLKVVDLLVNKNLILSAPYQDFNPIEYFDSETNSIDNLSSELKLVFDTWISTLKDTLNDPMIIKNLKLINNKDSELLKMFKNGSIVIDKQNARSILEIIMQLYEGLNKIELSIDSFKNIFNKPQTPDEAIESFKKYIDKISKGQERDKIRLILK